MPEMSTADSILIAAMGLFSEKGYAAVTTKEIAAKAHVNETTVFRHFETKQMLYKKVFLKYIVEPSFEDIFHKQIVWDLSKDLLNIASYFYNMVIQNSKLLQMNFRDSGEFLKAAHGDNFIARDTHAAKKELISYFSLMKEKGVITEEPEILATNFLMVNAGIIISLFYGEFEMKEAPEIYRDKLVNTFVNGIISDNI
jgi:AcrR family transcriptional regulator